MTTHNPEYTADYLNAFAAKYDDAVEIAKLMFGAVRRQGKSGYLMTIYKTRDNDDVIIERADTERGTEWHIYLAGSYSMTEVVAEEPAAPVVEAETTTTTEPCYTCGDTYNCPDCGVWLTREAYEEYAQFEMLNSMELPALTRILSEEAAPVEAAPIDLYAMTADVCGGCGGEGDCGLCGVWHSYEEYADAVAFKAANGYHAPAVKTMMGVGEAVPAPTPILSEEVAPAEAASQADAHIQLYREAQAVSNRNPEYPHAITWYAEDGSIRVGSFKHRDRIDSVIAALPVGALYALYSSTEPASAEAASVDLFAMLPPEAQAIVNAITPNGAPTPTDPRDAEIEALRSEVAALREMRERIITHAEGVLRYENVGPTEFFRGACGAYKTVLGIITRTNSTPVES